MRGISHCSICRRTIWPWQHYGFVTMSRGKERRWHPKCRTRQIVAARRRFAEKPDWYGEAVDQEVMTFAVDWPRGRQRQPEEGPASPDEV